MIAIENFALENLPGTIEKPDVLDHFFNLFSRVKKKEWQQPETRSRILFDGEPTQAKVSGISLKAQFRHADGYVLFTVYDYYDGEETYISFLDFDFNVLDELTFDGLFNRGAYVFDFVIVSADEIVFSVYEEEKRRLRIHSPPRTEFPVNCAELTARSIKGHFSKHFLKLEIKTI